MPSAQYYSIMAFGIGNGFSYSKNNYEFLKASFIVIINIFILVSKIWS